MTERRLSDLDTTALHSPDRGRLKGGGGRVQGTTVYLPVPIAQCVHLAKLIAHARLSPATAKRTESEIRARAEATLPNQPAALVPYVRMALDHPVPDQAGSSLGDMYGVIEASAWDLTLALRDSDA